MPQYLSIYSRHDYQDNGTTKTRWYKVGYMKLTENGGKFIRLFHQPHTDFFCFESEESTLAELSAEHDR
jgi:hypothetical protein